MSKTNNVFIDLSELKMTPELSRVFEGLMTVQFLPAENADAEAALREAAVMGNIQNLLLGIINHNISATTDYIGSELGYIIIVDDVPDRKEAYFDPRARPWYQLAAENGALSWTDVYPDAYSRGLAITCAKPYYDVTGRLAGVAGIGTVLDELTEIVLDTAVGETGYAFMVNASGEVIIPDDLSPDISVNMERLLNGGGVDRVSINGKESFIAHAALKSLSWSLITVIEAEEAAASAQSLSNV
ncbi:MAG: cache domain-containing protein [Clostridiales bacterium]|jgi:hypothetical protein|nr:cache domain-containing protein [Clostridiales bacterium]